MRILIRTSRWAILAQRLGGVAMPLLVISVGFHYLRMVTGDAFLAAIGFTGGVAAMAVLTGVVALVRLWFTGDLGWGKALGGLSLGILTLLPLSYYGSMALRYPPVTDIATVERGTLPLTFDPETSQMQPPVVLTTAEQDSTFPNAKTRNYPLGLFQTFGVVRSLVEDAGWDVRMMVEPGADFSPGRINARLTTLPGWREEVVLRVAGDPASAVVDMRSASLNARFDLGSNGTRIEDFMTALDDAVTTLLRDNPNANQPVEVEAEAEAVDPNAAPEPPAGSQ